MNNAAAASHKLIRSGRHWGLSPETNHIGAVIFTVVSEDLVRVFTYATWTEYSHTEELSREAARDAWKALRREGWAPDKERLAA